MIGKIFGNNKMQKITILYNVNKTDIKNSVSRIEEILKNTPEKHKHLYDFFNGKLDFEYQIRPVSTQNILYLADMDSDLFVTLGGDGTFIAQIRKYCNTIKEYNEITKWNKNPRFVGINCGNLGFLTPFSVDDFEDQFIDILRGGGILGENVFLNPERPRRLLEIKIFRGGERVKKFCAVNDIVINAGFPFRMIKLGIKFYQKNIENDYFAANFGKNHVIKGDGLLISTAMGSTAYSLSAGGPILLPDLDVFCMTPICSQSMASRPMVLSKENVCMINLLDINDDTTLTIDGQDNFLLSKKDFVCVSSFSEVVPIVILNNKKTYMEILSDKLGWETSD